MADVFHDPIGGLDHGNILDRITIPVASCYQCGKCSAGCPVADQMDLRPSVVMRMLQKHDALMDQQVLGSFSIWLCVSCEMCYQRCPMEIDIPKVMDFLRAESHRARKVHPKARNIVSFHESFLRSVRYTGRLYEMGLIMDYKFRTKNWFQDLTLAPAMMVRGKLHFLPERIEGIEQMKRIFGKTLNNE